MGSPAAHVHYNRGRLSRHIYLAGAERQNRPVSAAMPVGWFPGLAPPEHSRAIGGDGCPGTAAPGPLGYARSGPTRMTALPKFSPWKRPMKAFGASSRPE